MYQYTRLFGSYRVPLASGRDECPVVKGSRHIAVMLNDRIFTLDIFRKDGRVVPESDLRVALEQILKKSREGGTQAPISVFTSQGRDAWAANRTYLLADSLNQRSLNEVDTALFVVVLDPHEPATLGEANEILSHGDMKNRYYNLSLFLFLSLSLSLFLSLSLAYFYSMYTHVLIPFHLLPHILFISHINN